ncbi:hypothetical protein [Streptomyces triticisoli]|uniref:hypothetical protein n=1 Tax=Streptomyces triticisoli TaxID=2182797 RepID=UPI002FCD8135
MLLRLACPGVTNVFAVLCLLALSDRDKAAGMLAPCLRITVLERQPGWGHVRVIVSLLYRMVRRLLSVPAVLLRRDTAKDAALLVLRHENAVLRRQVAAPVRYESADRFWFAALSVPVPRRRRREAFPVTPGTLLAWHRGLGAAKWDHTARRRTGRPPERQSRRSFCGWLGTVRGGEQTDPRGAGPTRASDRRPDGLGDPQRRGLLG